MSMVVICCSISNRFAKRARHKYEQSRLCESLMQKRDQNRLGNRKNTLVYIHLFGGKLYIYSFDLLHSVTQELIHLFCTSTCLMERLYIYPFNPLGTHTYNREIAVLITKRAFTIRFFVETSYESTEELNIAIIEFLSHYM